MIDLPYSLVIEASQEEDFWCFYSAELEGFTGIGHSIEDCAYQARHGMRERARLLMENGLPVPQPSSNPTIAVQNQAVAVTAYEE